MFSQTSYSSSILSFARLMLLIFPISVQLNGTLALSNDANMCLSHILLDVRTGGISLQSSFDPKATEKMGTGRNQPGKKESRAWHRERMSRTRWLSLGPGQQEVRGWDPIHRSLMGAAMISSQPARRGENTNILGRGFSRKRSRF